MTHRERVLKTFQFQQPDRLAFDLMEGSVWRALLDYFCRCPCLAHRPVFTVNHEYPATKWVDLALGNGILGGSGVGQPGKR